MSWDESEGIGLMEDSAFVSQINPHNCIFVLVNYQTKLASTISSKDVAPVIDTALLLAKTAKTFEIPIILTTICAHTFGGPLLTPLRTVLPNREPIDCRTLSVWEDKEVSAVLEKIGRKKLVMAGFWTNFSLTLSAIQALQAGFKVYIVSDACGDLSDGDDKVAVRRMIAAGAVVVNSSQLLFQFHNYR